MNARPRIGELLISAGLLDAAQLELALERQRNQGAGGRRLGQLVVEMGFVTEVQVAKVLSQQLSVPWVSLAHIDFSPELLELVSREDADEFCLIPVYVRHERRVGRTLYLAMEDPTHDDAVRRVMASSGLPVKSMIAAPSDIRAAIRAFYGSRFGESEPSVVHPVVESPAPTAPSGAASDPAEHGPERAPSAETTERGLPPASATAGDGLEGLREAPAERVVGALIAALQRKRTVDASDVLAELRRSTRE